MNVKRTDAQVFLLGHKEYNFRDDLLFTPVQLNANLGLDICNLKDNIGDNISDWNDSYAEMTGTYFIWKNIATDIRLKYIGQTTYRRPFELPEDFNFDEAFESYDIILPKKKDIDTTNYDLYKTFHYIEDFNDLRIILDKYFKEYVNDYDTFSDSTSLYNGNGFIMKRKDFNNFCFFYFYIIDKMKELRSIKTQNDIINHCMDAYKKGGYLLWPNQEEGAINYEKRIYGFLAERILNIYINHNFKNILEINYNLLETDY